MSPRHLIVQFNSYEDAVNCYNDPDYQASLEFLRKGVRRELTIMEGKD